MNYNSVVVYTENSSHSSIEFFSGLLSLTEHFAQTVRGTGGCNLISVMELVILSFLSRTEWIDAISRVSKELRKADVEDPNPKVAPKTEGATVPKLGIKVGGVLYWVGRSGVWWVG